MSTTEGVTNVVLVHGAFADGSGWRNVYENLTARGFTVSIVQNPLTSFEDDLAATRRVLDRLDGPAVLVGHSWGGTVITEAGSHPNVASLVYVAALIPDSGQTSGEQYEGFAPTPEFVIDVRDDGFGYLDRDAFVNGFAADASEADAAFLRDAQVPVNMSVFGAAVTHAAWHDKPSWAVIATEDKAFDQAMLLHMAQRAGAQITTTRGSHAVYLTQPDVVSDVIVKAAAGALVAAADYAPFDASLLPPAVARYLDDHADVDRRDSVAELFAPDARVVDEGIEYQGRDAIRGWLNKAASEYTYTSTLLGQQSVGDGRWVVLSRLEGNFPGGVVDLRYRVAVAGDQIVDLVIAP